MLGGQLAPNLSEEAFQSRIVGECAWRRLKWHHETDSRRTRAGWPDLVIAGPGGVVFAELKREGKKPTDDQQRWLDALRDAGAEVYLWHPSDWPEITRVLQRLAQPRPLPREET